MSLIKEAIDDKQNAPDLVKLAEQVAEQSTGKGTGGGDKGN